MAANSLSNFANVKKYLNHISISILVAVFSSILFQSVHTFEHILAEFSEDKCEHLYDTGSEQITHEHHNFDHCFSCDFHFSNYVKTEILSVPLYFRAIYSNHFALIIDQPPYYSGIHYLLRGPPNLLFSTVLA